MDQILDILYDYSKRGKQVDYNFSKKVIEIVSKEQDLKGFLKRVKFTSIKGKEYEDCPLTYSFSFRELRVDQQKLEHFWQIMLELLKSEGYLDFELILATNTFSLHALLHDLEHAHQLKKAMLDNTFEQKLLAICLYSDLEFLKEDIFSKILMRKYGIYFNYHLFHNLKLYRQLEEQYDRLIPVERMANIYATREINMMLQKIDNVKEVEDLFLKVLNAFYRKGYSGTCLSPTETFLEDVRNLQFLGMEEKMNQEFYHSLEEAKKSPLEERLTLGLPITREEYQKIKTLSIRNL